MRIPTYRLLAAVIPLQCAAMLGFAWYATRPAVEPQPGRLADRIVVTKSAHTLVLYSHGAVFRSYKVALGRASGPKQRQGDHRTPEGRYVVDAHSPHSRFHLALHISYPNAEDRAQHRTGSDIMIHGLRNGLGWLGATQRWADWTDGCIAVTDAEMEEIYRLVPNNTPIDIEP